MIDTVCATTNAAAFCVRVSCYWTRPQLGDTARSQQASKLVTDHCPLATIRCSGNLRPNRPKFLELHPNSNGWRNLGRLRGDEFCVRRPSDLRPNGRFCVRSRVVARGQWRVVRPEFTGICLTTDHCPLATIRCSGILRQQRQQRELRRTPHSQRLGR